MISASAFTGGTVTAITAQRMRRDRVNVYVDDQFAFALAADVAASALLRIGDLLDAGTLDSLFERERFQTAFNQACHLLSFRPRSEREVRQHLAKASPDPDLVDRVVARLKELKFVDDTAFARFWVENRAAFRPRGARALAHELRLKGVQSDVSQDILEEAPDEEDGAYRAAAKKARALATLDEGAFRQRLSAFLLRRGFDYGVVSATVTRLRREHELADNDDDFETESDNS
ncbi:MAG TPA: RecX family transcriptional regulator [Chloroflexota bacterium]|nr:RecX family transcriptional regulator [Chloroflexota bacterium]